MKSFYFVRVEKNDNTLETIRLVVIEYKYNQWQESVAKQGVSEPSLPPDGNTFYLKREYIERTSERWSELKSLGAPFENIDIMRLLASSNGTYYFDTYSPKLDTPIRYSRLIKANTNNRSHWTRSLVSADIMPTPSLYRMKATLSLIA